MEPANSIITRLGGTAAVQKATSISRYRVWRWTQPREKGGTGGLIPQRHHVALLDYARATDVPLTAADFLPVSSADEKNPEVVT